MSAGVELVTDVHLWDPSMPADLAIEAVPANSRKKLVRGVSMFLWVAAIVLQATRTLSDPSAINFISLTGFVSLFFAVNAQLLLVGWLGERRLRRLVARLHGSAYLSDLDNLPNRNYLLSELRREMPRARAHETTFVVIVLSLDNYAEVVQRRGPEFGQRALNGMAQVLRRFTRTSDFIAHLGGAEFAVLLNECRYQDSFVYLQRVPGSIAVSDGHRMFEVPISARVHEYDMQSLYATDVLRDAEETRPLRRREVQHHGTEAA
jgi:diguanylate cyclase (GGDEF)-like protein